MIGRVVGVRNPYPGLRPFEAEEAEYFFGRERQVDELLLRLREHRFVGVLGLSGSGKSSLVRAGLIPALRVGHLTTSGSRWRIALMRPGSEPMDALAAALNQALCAAPDRTASLWKSTNALLHDSRTGRQPNESLLVMVDQFEELFRVEDIREAAHFVDLLLAVEQDVSPEFRTYVVLTMRTDRLGECAHFDGLPEALNRSQYLVPKMGSGELREAIEGPAALTDTGIDPALVQKLVVEASEGSDRLPLLQHLLMILWHGRQPSSDNGSLITLAQYQTARSAADALNDHADRALLELGSERQCVTSLVFRALTGGGAGRDLRRPLRISQLAAETGAPLDDVRAVVEHFHAANFLTSPDRALTADWEADITHESLIRQWKKLAGWVQVEAQDADDYRYYSLNATRDASPLTGRSLESAVQWVNKGHSPAWAARYGGDLEATIRYIRRSEQLSQEEEFRKERARRRAYVVAGVCLLAALGVGALAVYAWRARSEAIKTTKSLKETEQKARTAEQTAIKAAEEAWTAEKKATKAAEEARTAEREAKDQRTIAENQAVIANRERDNSQRSRALATRATSSAIAAGALAQSDSETALLLSVQAVNIFPELSESYGRLWQFMYTQHLPLTSWESSERLSNVWVPEDWKLIIRGPRTKVWDMKNGLHVSDLKIPLNAVWSQDGRWAAASEGKSVRVWNTILGDDDRRIEVTATPRAFASDARVLATHTAKHEIHLWNLDTLQQLARFDNTEYANSLAVSSDGRRVATRSASTEIRVFNVGSDQPIASARVADFHSFRFLSNQSLAYVSQGTLHQMPGGTGDMSWELGMLPTAWISTANGQRIAARNPDGVRIISLGSRPARATIPRTPALNPSVARRIDVRNVINFAFSKDGTALATIADKGVQLWDAVSGHEIWRGAHPKVAHLAFTPDDSRIVTVSSDGNVKVWQREPDGMLPLGDPNFSGAAFSPDGRRIAMISSEKGELDIIHLNGATPPISLPHPDGLRVASFTSDGRALVTGSKTETLIWDMQNIGAPPIRLTGGTGSASLTSDRRLLARQSSDYSGAIVRDLKTGQETKFSHKLILVVALSPDGRHLITTGDNSTTTENDGALLLWSLSNPAKPLKAVTLENRPHEGTFSLDGKWLAIATEDERVTVYEAPTLTRVTRFAAPGRLVALDFAEDDLMAAVRIGGKVRILRYPLSPNRAMAEACRKVTRNLTVDEWSSFIPYLQPAKTCPEHPEPKQTQADRE